MEIMEYCPQDSSMTGVFQSLAVKWLEIKAGPADGEGGAATGGDTERVGAPFPSKTDPAASQDHGHRAGVRRDSAAEGERAGSEIRA